MHIIITDAWQAKSRTLHLNGVKLVLMALAGSCLLMLGAVATYHWVFLEGVRQGWPGFGSMAKLVTQGEVDANKLYMRENLDAMARRLGEMQARMVQIESLGERVASLAGLDPAQFRTPPASGGALVSPRSMTPEEFHETLGRLDTVSGAGLDWLTAIESRLFDQKIRRSMLPTQAPVDGSSVGSPFGFRIDPITGRTALHTGLDFPANTGTPILAAAGGVVVVQQYHPAYGNMVEIDHGNDLITRYAHASRVLVKKGDLVKRGQHIADVGSTGRSTGPHLHFEVWVAGVPQDPRRFLNAGENVAALLPHRQAPPGH